MIKKIIITVFILAITGGFIGYKMYNKPHVDVAETSAEINVNANDLMSEFSINENTANKKYLEKIVAVSGKITSITIENEKPIITLQTNDDFGSILCHFDEKNATINQLKEGQNTTIKGICTGYLMDVVLVKCAL
jgi:DNA/RNA endonuclease YhcR with UshA esterase domain